MISFDLSFYIQVFIKIKHFVNQQKEEESCEGNGKESA